MQLVLEMFDEILSKTIQTFKSLFLNLNDIMERFIAYNLLVLIPVFLMYIYNVLLPFIDNEEKWIIYSKKLYEIYNKSQNIVMEYDSIY